MLHCNDHDADTGVKLNSHLSLLPLGGVSQSKHSKHGRSVWTLELLLNTRHSNTIPETMFLQTSDGLQLYVHLAFQCDDVTTLLLFFYPKILEVS